ncbi:hypothetical protein BD626DRAFT_540617 [Schizophyllum amplum]|uniref:Uncharacterized protein n=1 Tax=Schizophyllum amplum TaxID=97359 RepID=A0A550BY33_9AGAR|nr:hypothetical protein BD626DRAFT_540617 [Auriculariopsis ampla]
MTCSKHLLFQRMQRLAQESGGSVSRARTGAVARRPRQELRVVRPQADGPSISLQGCLGRRKNARSLHPPSPLHFPITRIALTDDPGVLPVVLLSLAFPHVGMRYGTYQI